MRQRRALRQFTLSTGKSAGRNSSGRITVFHRGGGSKRLQRRIDLKRSTSSIGVSQKERPPKVRTTKIGIVIRSFDHSFFENHFWGLPPYTRKIGLPESRVLYTVLRSPHIDKKSREQFYMKIKKEFLVIKTERHELRKKFFWLKRQRIFGAQYEILFSCKTRLDKGKLQRLL